MLPKLGALPQLGALRGASPSAAATPALAKKAEPAALQSKPRILVTKLGVKIQPPQLVVVYTDLKHSGKKRVKYIDIPGTSIELPSSLIYCKR